LVWGEIDVGEAWGRCIGPYIGVWEEFRRIKIQVRDKIRVYLKNKIL
jgi:hypothetical protein